MGRGRTDTALTKRAASSGNGRRETGPFRLEPPRRKVQIPQLMVAVFVVAVSALVAVVLFSQASARDPILALANSVERGQAVASDDLMVVYVATDDPIASLPADAVAGLVGLAAVADLDAGTIVTPAHFVSRSVLDGGDGVVGLALAPGEYPTPMLAPGDVVDVVVTSRSSAESGAAATGDMVVASAVVFDIAELGTRGERFISLQMPAGAAAEVAGAAAADRVRLVLVAGPDQ
jgi:hypothetical protein